MILAGACYYIAGGKWPRRVLALATTMVMVATCWRLTIEAWPLVDKPLLLHILGAMQIAPEQTEVVGERSQLDEL